MTPTMRALFDIYLVQGNLQGMAAAMEWQCEHEKIQEVLESCATALEMACVQIRQEHFPSWVEKDEKV